MYGVASDFGLFAEQLIAPATEPMRNHAQLDTDKQRRDNRTNTNAAQSVQEDQAGDERNDDHGHVKCDFDGRERLAGQRGDGQHSAFTGQRHNVRRNVEKDADCNENSGNPAHQQTDNQVVRRWKHRRERVAGGRECAEHHADRNLQQIFAFKAAAHQQHYSGAVVFENIFDISGIFGISKFTAVAILCVVIGIIGGCYAIFGGLKAVAVSDTINGIGLIIGGLMIPFLALALLGHETTGGGLVEGVKYLVQAEPEKLNAWASWDAAEPALPWPLIFTGMFFNNLYWWCTNQSFVQRALAAKSLKEGQKGAIYCGFLKTIGFFYLVLPGVIAYHLPSIQDKLAAAGSSAIDFAYPALVSAVVPKPVMGFFAAVLFGAILSSFNSVLNSASTMFTLDLYRTAINPKASDMQCVKVGKIYGTCAGAVAICVAPFVMFAQGITTFLNSMSQFVSLPILFTVLGALIFRKAPKYAPKVITAVHVIAYGAFMILKPCYPTSGEPIHYLYAIAVLFVVEFAIMWYLNKYRGTEDYVPADVGAVDLTPWKYRHIVCIIGIILAIGIYILFSPIGIAA